MSNQNPDNRSASQKITDLENAVAGAYQTISTMARDLTVARDAIKLLGSKLEAVVRATNTSQPLTDQTLSKIMIDMNCEELDQKVKDMVAAGSIAPQEVVGPDSFLVGEEQDKDGKVINPRLQLGLFKIVPEVQQKILGAKAGDIIEISADLKFKLLATYKIIPVQQTPQEVPAPAESTPAEAQPEAAAPAAPAPEQSSSDAAPAAVAADSSAPSA